ncbi:MAG TPA: hypothetical protein VIO81_14755 [Methyloversatilis sp.]
MRASNNFRHVAAALALVVVPAAIPAADSADRPGTGTLHVLLSGDFHGDEVAHGSGPGWFALVLKSGTARLEPVALKVSRVFDAVLDEEGKPPYTGKRVASLPAVEALALLRGAGLKPGPLDSATLTGTRQGLAAKSFSLGARRYTLDVAADCGKRAGTCRWTLSDGALRQTLAELEVTRTADGRLETDSASTGLIWAGDLDGDGRLDLILDVSNHDNAVAQVRVFLSSRAAPGRLVGEAASFGAVGC